MWKSMQNANMLHDAYRGLTPNVTFFTFRSGIRSGTPIECVLHVINPCLIYVQLLNSSVNDKYDNFVYMEDMSCSARWVITSSNEEIPYTRLKYRVLNCLYQKSDTEYIIDTTIISYCLKNLKITPELNGENEQIIRDFIKDSPWTKIHNHPWDSENHDKSGRRRRQALELAERRNDLVQKLQMLHGNYKIGKFFVNPVDGVAVSNHNHDYFKGFFVYTSRGSLIDIEWELYPQETDIRFR